MIGILLCPSFTTSSHGQRYILYCPRCSQICSSKLAVGIVVFIGENVCLLYAFILGILKNGMLPLNL